jgi:hypothetical protein
MEYMMGIGICNSIGGGGAAKPDGAPSNLILTASSDTTISGAFDIGSTNHDGHYAYYSTDGVNYTKAVNAEAVMKGANNTFQITGLISGTLYYVYVVAYKGTNLSDPSNIATKETISLPSDIDALLYWFDPSQLTGLADNDVITDATDFSGNSNTPTQSNASYKGIYKTNIQNGHPVIRLDGSNDRYRKLSVPITQPITVFVAAKPNNIYYIFDTNGAKILFQTSTGYTRFAINAGITLPTLTSNATFGTFVIGYGVINGVASSVKINGGYAVSGTAGVGGGDRIELFSDTTESIFFQGDCGDIIIYNGVLLASVARRIEEYLAWKYAITLVPI